MSITEKQLAEIKGRIAEGRRVPPFDVRDLADEVTRLRAELAKTREVTDEKVERVLHAVKPYVSDRLADLEAEDMAWNATRVALGGGDDAR